MQSYFSTSTLVVVLLFGVACNRAEERSKAPASVEAVSHPPAFDDAFWKQWGDGQAELAGYDLLFPRYGELRRGVAITIFVSETFSNSLRVKADPGKHAASDQFPVMKLNLVEDFQTGIYDYNTMTSSFVALAPANGRPAGSLTKVSFSSQEWCGQVYSHLLFDRDGVRQVLHSYFDGEADQQSQLPYPAGALSEDALWHWARGFAAPSLAPGETREAPLLTSLESSRLRHKPLSWAQAALSRSSASQSISVPAGNIEVEVWSVRLQNGPTRTFYVEKAEPHRIIKWETSDGERAELLASDRLKYWEMHAEGDEAALRKIGLSRRPPRTP